MVAQEQTEVMLQHLPRLMPRHMLWDMQFTCTLIRGSRECPSEA